MAEPGKALPSQLESVLLLARDYGASSQQDHLQWFVSNLLEAKQAVSLEDDNLFILDAHDSEGRHYGLSQIEESAVLSSMGSGALYKEAMAQRSAKQVLASGNVSLLDLTALDAPHSTVALSSVLKVITSGEREGTKTSWEDEKVRAVDLPLRSVSTKTKVHILACKYRIVFTLDASPSMATVDPITGEVLFDQLYFGLEKVLTSLVLPIRIAHLELRPQIHASFLLQGSSTGTLHVMLHGMLITAQTLANTLLLLKQALLTGESAILAKTQLCTPNAASGAPMPTTQAPNTPFSPNVTSSLPLSSSSSSSPNLATSTLPSPTNFTLADLGSPLKNAMFILKMLPLDACPLILLFTDGVTMLPEESEAYDSLLMLMRREDIACSVIRVGHGFHDFASFAYVPDADFLRHFVACTSGSYFELPSLLDDTGAEDETRVLLSLRDALLIRAPIGEKVRPKVQTQSVEFGDMASSDAIDHPYPWEGNSPRQSLYRIPFRQYQLVGVNIMDLLSCRYREGFTFHKSHIEGQATREISIKLILPWKELIFISYTIKATYYNDIPNGTPEIQVALDVLAYYDVQVQWSQWQRSGGPQSNNPTNMTPSLMITRLQQFILCVIDTDKKLNALTSHTIALNEIIGRSLQTPLHVQIEKVFWKILSQLPKNVWHRWFKMERMEIILSPDLLLNANATASTSSTRIELRIRAEDLISNPYGSASAGAISSPALGSSGTRDSFSQTTNNTTFRFDAATKELQTYFDNWNCFTGSKHSFARVLEHTVITGSNASQIIAAISSKPDLDGSGKAGGLAAATKASNESRTLTVPAFCVARLSWESKNAAMLSFYFFGVSSADRYKLLSGIYRDLMSRTNPNDPSTSLFNICSKPLRYSLIRYNMALLKDMMGPTDNLPTILSNILPSLLSPSLVRSASQNGVGTVAGTNNMGSSSSAPPPLSKQSSLQTVESQNTKLGNASSDCVLTYSTEDVNLKALASFSPIYHLLVQYMNHKRWIWNINSEVTQEAAIDALVRCRLNEGFLLLSNVETMGNQATGLGAGPSPATRHGLHSFFKEITVTNDPKDPSTSQPCIVQYLIYHTPQGYLVTELWMEPIQGSIVPLTNLDDSLSKEMTSAFECLKRLLYDVDLHVISTIFTFDTLSLLHNPHTTRDILSVPTEVKEYTLDSPLANVTVQRPPFNLKGLTSVAIQHEEYFTGFEKDDNAILHSCLHASLSYICDRQLPNKGTFAAGDPSSPVFAKAIANSPEILLVTLHPLGSSSSNSSLWNSSANSSSSGHSTPIFPITPTQPRNTSKSYTSHSAYHPQLQPFGSSSSFSPSVPSYLPASSDHNESILSQIPNHLTISVYQCSRVVEPPKESTDRIKTLLGTVSQLSDEASTIPQVITTTSSEMGIGALPSSSTSASASSAIGQLCEVLQAEHHRGFVKALYQKLQKGKVSELTSKDHTYALQVCQEYMMELDLTQFFRILVKHMVSEEDIQRRRGGPSSLPSLGSYGSDSSSPLDFNHHNDTSLLFDRILAHHFRKVPGTDAHFYLAPPSSSSSVGDSETEVSDADSDATALSLDEDVAVHIAHLNTHDDAYESHGEESEDLDDWIDDLSKRYRSAAVITSTNANITTSMASGPAAPTASKEPSSSASSAHTSQTTTNSNMIAQALATWSTLPLFLRMECAIVPKPGSNNTSNPINAESSHPWGDGNSFTPQEGSSIPPHISRPRRDSPSGGSRSQLRPPNSPYDTHSNLDREPLNITAFPISTLPNPKQISALQQLSATGNRATIRVFAIVLPKHGDGASYDGSTTPMDIANSPASDGTSPLASGASILLSKEFSHSGASQYTKLPRIFRRTLDQLKSAIRSLTAQKSLDTLRLRVPVTRVISDIVSLCMRQLNPNAYITMKIPLLFIDPQQGISLFFNEFPKWSLQPIRVIDRTLFFLVLPNPSVQFFTQPLSITTSVEFNNLSGMQASAPTPDGYSIPYWLFMSPTSTHVHIRFQSPPGLLKKHEKDDILDKTRENIHFVCKRINQILLLTQLYEHRVCNVLLVNDSDGNTTTEKEETVGSQMETRSPASIPPSSVDSPRSKPIFIPSRENTDRKPIDEEGIFQHDDEQNTPNRDSPHIPEAPRLPTTSTNNESPMRSLSSLSRSQTTFHPGQFACEKVHEIHLPLNWRTDPKTILNAIANTVLVHFSVNNRNKMYVYREQSGRIFYMTLSITTSQDEPGTNLDQHEPYDRAHSNTSAPTTMQYPAQGSEASVIAASSSITIAPKDTEPSAMDLVSSSVASASTSGMQPSNSGSLVRSREGTKPSSASVSGVETNWITLRVYGIDLPSEEITVQLRNTLESRLAHFTLQVISSMLLRNPLMRIKTADEVFLRSPDVAPRRFQIELPSFITDIGLFRTFVKSNLLKQGLTLLNLETDRAYDTAGGSSTRAGGRTPETESILSTPQHSNSPAVTNIYGDAGSVYLYNNVTGAPGKSMQLNFGAGLATISVMLQSPYGTFPQYTDTESSIGSHSSYDAGPLFEPLSLEDSPMHDIFLSVLSSSEVPHDRDEDDDDDDDENGDDGDDGDDRRRETVLPSKKRGKSISEPQALTSTFVDIKVWTKGTIEVQKIIEHMEKIVNQTIAEYQFEWYAYLAEARESSPMDYNQFICDVQRLLEHATKLETPSIRTMNIPINVQSWAISSYLKELQKRFVEINNDFHPDIYYMDLHLPGNAVPSVSLLSSQPISPVNDGSAQPLGKVDLSKRDFLSHHIASITPHGLASSHSFGSLRASHPQMKEMKDSGAKSTWRPYDVDQSESKSGELANMSSHLFFRSSRRFSLLCTKDSLLRAWNPKMSSLKVGRDTLASRSVLKSSLASSQSPLERSSLNPSSLTSESPQSLRSFAILFLDTSSNVQLYSYNWTPAHMELIAQLVLRDTNFLNLRQNLVGNILHQKMGLFHHNAPMAELTTLPPYSGPHATSAISYRSAPQLAKMTRFLPPACYHAQTTTQEAGSSSTVGYPSSGTTVNVQQTNLILRYTFDNVDFLAHTTTLPSTKRAKEDSSIPILSPSTSTRDLSPASAPNSPAPSKVKRRVISAKLSDLKIDEFLHRISPMTQISFHVDPVFRHAMQFIAISERYMRAHQVQQTLLHIYSLWSKNHTKKPHLLAGAAKGPSTASKTTTETHSQNEEKGTIDTHQLATLVHSARLFHAVKIPFFLTDVFLAEDLFEGPTTITHIGGRGGQAESKIDVASSASASEMNSTSEKGSEDAGPTMRIVPIFPTQPTGPSSQSNESSPPKAPGGPQPFLYSAGETTQRAISRPELNLRFDPSTHPRERQLKYRQYLLNQFLDEFVTYLATFGVTPVKVKPVGTPIKQSPSHASHLSSSGAAAPGHPTGQSTSIGHSTSIGQSTSAGSAPNSTPMSRVSQSLSPSDAMKESPLATPSTASNTAHVDINPPKQQRYLQKVFRGGLILFEVEGGGSDNFSVSCNVFTLFFNRLTSYFGASEDVIGARSASSLKHLAHFTREIANVKSQLHMNSFVYDFHVRHISHLFSNAPSLSSSPSVAASTPEEANAATDASKTRAKATPNESNSAKEALSSKVATLPNATAAALPTIPPVEIINQLQAMVIYYEHPPKHSRTALASSHITVDVTNALLSPLELFAYATKHAKSFGFHPTEWGLTPGVVRFSKCPDFHIIPIAPIADRGKGGNGIKDGNYGKDRKGEKDAKDAKDVHGHVDSGNNADHTHGKDVEEDSWVMLAFMSHTSDATSATNQAISMSLAGGHLAMESNYNACYRVARHKHLAAVTMASSGSNQNLGLPTLDLPPSSPTSPTINASASASNLKVSIVDQPPVNMVTSASISSSSSSLHSLPTSQHPVANLPNIASPLRGKLNLSASMSTAPKAPKQLTISFFVLRVPMHTIFPLMASAFATPPPLPPVMDEVESVEEEEKRETGRLSQSASVISRAHTASPPMSHSTPGSPLPPPTSLAAYNRRNMSDAIHNCKVLLTGVANRSVTESERDVLWSKLVADNVPSSPDFLHADHLSQMLRLAHSRPIDVLDATLTSMTSGITTDWKHIMNQLSTSYAAFYKTRVFLSEDTQQPHLLIFNPADSDLLIHLYIVDPKRIEAFCVRREFNASLDTKHLKSEATQISQLVNTICHLLWKQLLPKPVRR